MADSARVVVGIDTVLRGLEKTVKGIDTVTAKLTNLSKIKAPALGKASTANFDKATVAAHRQAVQIQELANRQERARQASERLAQSQRRLADSSARLEAAQKRQAQASERAAAASSKQADAHVKEFRAAEAAALRSARQVAAINAQTQRQAQQQIAIRDRAARSLASVETREAKRTADAFSASLTKQASALQLVSGKLGGVSSGLQAISSGFASVGRSLTATVTAPLLALGVISTKSAIDIDTTRNRLIALEGTVEKANDRLVRLRQLAQESAGVTTRGANEAFTQLLAIGGLTEKTIDRQIKALGKLNAAFTIDDQNQFFRNLTQIFTQGFERADIKEAIGRVPIFNQLLAQAFGTSDPEALRKLKESGKLTLDGFMAGFAGAVESDKRIAQIGESISTRFAKAFDRLSVAIAPIGEAIIPILEDIIGIAEPVIVSLTDLFKGLSKPVKTTIVVLAGVAAAAGPVLIAFGGIAGVLAVVVQGVQGFLAAAAAVGGVAALLTGVGEVLLVIVGVLAVAAIAGAALFKAWQTNFGGIRDTVTKVLDVIQDGFNRVLPNILSLTEKVTKGIHAFWARFGPQITAVVEAVFGRLVRGTEAVITVVTNMVVLVTKLIDGDWRGAWDSFKRILEAGIRSAGDLIGSLVRVIGLAMNGWIDLLKSSARRFVELGTQLAKSTAQGFATFITGDEATRIAVTATLKFLAGLPERIKFTAIAIGADLAKSVVEGFIDGITGTQALPPLKVPSIAPDVTADNKRVADAKAVNDLLAQQALDRADKTEKATTAIRNAQEALNKARAERQKSADDQLIEQERIKNEQLLTANENGFKLQLVAYRQYLNERARLTSQNIQLEINQQKQIAEQALAQRDRLLARASQKGVPRAERLRAEAGAEEADARRIQALTIINRLESEQRSLVREVNQALAEAQQQQEKDVRQLQIAYAELTGRIEESLNAATDAAIEERLKALALAQEDLNKRLQFAREIGDADAKAEIKNAQRINQTEIEILRNKTSLERATNVLAVAERFVTESKEKQAQLEQQIAFDVEFRGLKEQEAIRGRLAGEDALRQRLLISRDIIQDTVNALQAQGLKPPQALIDFLKNAELAIKGLGELSFTEQFRLAQQEFERLNDERIQKIQEVERAVRNRALAEVEGQILIRRLNGQYVADLENQARILREIAEKSGQRDLQRQAQSAADTARDASDEMASFSKQIETAGKDAARSGLTDFFSDILNRTKSAKEAVIDLLGSIARKVNDVIAENLSKGLFESIFGTGKEGGGILARIRGIFGGTAPTEQIAQAAGGLGEQAALTTAATTAAASLTTGATAAATALGTGAASAAAAMTAGGTAAGTAMVTGGTTVAATLTASAAAFSAAVIAAGAAFAAAVAAASAANTAASAAGSFASGGQVPINVSRGELYVPPKPVSQYGVSFWNALNAKRLKLNQVAGILRGPGSETSDSIPALAPKGSFILKADATRYYSEMMLRRIYNSRRTRGYAEGGFVSSVPDGEMGGVFRSGQMDLKQVLVDARNNRLQDFLSTSEDRQFLLDVISDEISEIRRRLRIRD